MLFVDEAMFFLPTYISLLRKPKYGSLVIAINFLLIIAPTLICIIAYPLLIFTSLMLDVRKSANCKFEGVREEEIIDLLQKRTGNKGYNEKKEEARWLFQVGRISKSEYNFLKEHLKNNNYLS